MSSRLHAPLAMGIALVLMTTALAQTPPPAGAVPAAPAQPEPAPPQLPPPGSLVTPPAPPNPLQQQSPQQPSTPPVGQPPSPILPGIEGPEDVVLQARPVLRLKGQSTWDDGYENLMEAFQKLAAEARRLNLVVDGRPKAVFTSTDDNGFRYEAVLPLANAPATPPPAAARGFDFTQSPDGKALKFTHTGAYDDIDTTYEAITAYMDEKGLKAKNLFVEEYLTDTKASDDPELKMNIFILIE